MFAEYSFVEYVCLKRASFLFVVSTKAEKE